jgi:hypothetical protein
MLTAEDKEEIRRFIGEVMERKSSRQTEGDVLQNLAGQLRDLVINEGFTEVSLLNPDTGEKRTLIVSVGTDSIVEVTARAIEVFGSREKAIRWLRTPVRALGNQTPISMLGSHEGLTRVQDVLGQVEHGVW